MLFLIFFLQLDIPGWGGGKDFLQEKNWLCVNILTFKCYRV